MLFSATTSAAGATNATILARIDSIITPSAGIAPALPISISANAATRNSVVSFAVIFKNPTTNPRITSTHTSVDVCHAGTSPATIAISIPSMNAQLPNFASIISTSVQLFSIINPSELNMFYKCLSPLDKN